MFALITSCPDSAPAKDDPDYALMAQTAHELHLANSHGLPPVTLLCACRRCLDSPLSGDRR
jgi:hypothetical protein